MFELRGDDVYLRGHHVFTLAKLRLELRREVEEALGLGYVLEDAGGFIDTDKIKAACEFIEETNDGFKSVVQAIRDWSEELTFSCELERIALLHELDETLDNMDNRTIVVDDNVKLINKELYA